MAIWLFSIALMIFFMITLGGFTRLTQSGLSMVEWRPITGWLPPLTEVAWNDLFKKYQAFPEFRENNSDMNVSDFKGIFWLEYFHRLWGRIIGVAFFIPFVFFLLRGWVSFALGARLLIMFVGGGLQGVLGWYMVKSGLVDQPDVSQYRLAAHLSLALAIYCYTFWVALILWRDGVFLHSVERITKPMTGLFFIVFVTAFSGALVAGLDAGLAYNTFPLMDGDAIPEGLFSMTPAYTNIFENVLTVQFNHRVLAFLCLGSALSLWFYARHINVHQSLKVALNVLIGTLFLQAILGIFTLIFFVPTILAAGHQAGAVCVLTACLWGLREAKGA
ncbi:MAG: hypothetical protein CBB68_08040 [Rhodospirillaceae bacterium TMED8]|nr:heme A synthase [Magnetovibrio sp.]OUT50926.1 MAG: hypothetical protein CBB68_08040 [Rhodospirillaceae bacterium TMED8]